MSDWLTKEVIDSMVKVTDLVDMGHSMLMHKLAKYVKALASEVERLQAIVDRLPKTADGVPVVPGCDEVYHVMRTGEIEKSSIWRGWGVAFLSDEDDGGSWLSRRLEECYSTREAAEKAREP